MIKQYISILKINMVEEASIELRLIDEIDENKKLMKQKIIF